MFSFLPMMGANGFARGRCSVAAYHGRQRKAPQNTVIMQAIKSMSPRSRSLRSRKVRMASLLWFRPQAVLGYLHSIPSSKPRKGKFQTFFGPSRLDIFYIAGSMPSL